MTKTIARPALRYHGGKFAIADWIIQKMPPHRIYVEPFGGGGGVLLRKPSAYLDVYNDLNHMVVNFFQILRDREQELIRAIELTPFSRVEYIRSQTPTDDPLENARRLYIWAWQGRGRAGIVEKGGWRFMRTENRGTTTVDDWNNINHLWAISARLKKVQIECRDAIEIIRIYDGPDTLFYIDPPYLHKTRGKRWLTAYAHELSDQQHKELSEALHQVQAAVILSGYRSELYDTFYKDWEKHEKTVTKDNKGGNAIECLWLNPKASQKNLFT